MTAAVVWTRQFRSAYWVGATGTVDYADRFRFGISKTKSPDAPRTAHRMYRRRGEWTYVYSLTVHRDGATHAVGTFPSLEAAKAAAIWEG